MLIIKILQEFLLPSVFLLVLILLGLIFLLGFKKKKIRKIGRLLILLSIILYYVFSITPIANLILKPLENQYQPVPKNELGKTNKIVLLLGGGKETNVLRASEILRISDIKNPSDLPEPEAKIIISGTSPLNPGRKDEAEWLKEFLAERGILSENIILEEKSRNTFESAKNIKELLGKEPFFLITSAYHMPRSMEVFQKMGANSIPAPTDFKRKENYNILDFFPDANNLRKVDLAFHEYFGILFYRLYYY